MDVEIYDVLDKLAEQYSISAQRVDEFLDLTDAIIHGKLPVAKMPDFIKEAFGVSAEDAKAIAIQLAGHRLLPLEFYLPGVEKQIIEWGGNIADFPDLRIKDDPITIGSILRDHAAAMGLELPDHLMKRFVYLCRGYITKERAKEATATMMKRPLTIGGLGLKEEQIEKLLTWLDTVDLSKAEDFQDRGSGFGNRDSEVGSQKTDQERGSSFVEASDDKQDKGAAAVATAEGVTASSDQVNSLPEPKPEPKPEPAPTSSPKDEKSIPRMDLSPSASAELRSDRSSAEPRRDGEGVGTKTASALAIIPTKALADEVPTIAGELIEDHEKAEVEVHQQVTKRLTPAPDMQRLKGIVEDAASVLLDHAKKSKKLTKKKALALAESVIKGRLDTSRLYQQLKELYEFGIADAQLVIKPLMDAKKAWEQSHNQDGSANGSRRMAGQAKQMGESSDERSLMDRRHAALTKSPSKQSIEPVLPGARVSAARSKEEELAAGHRRVDVTAEQVAKEKDRPAPAKVKLSLPSVPPKVSPQEKQTVTDVKYSPQLVGPVEELGTMGVTDFRRLSSDPKEAIRKILDTLSLLEEMDYEQRIAGVVAWRKSPMNALYLDIVQEGLLAGSSVAEIASRRRNKGQESLSPAELQAIVDLNTQIAF